MKITAILLLAICVACGLALAQTASGQEKIIIRAGFTSNIDSPPGRELRLFKQLVEGKHPGKVEVQIFPDEQLGKGTEMLQNVRSGNLEMGVFISEIPSLDVRLGYVELPWLYDSDAHFAKVMAGAVGKELLGIIGERGAKPLSIWWNGYRQVGTTKKAIRKPEDMKGLKIRIAANPQRTRTFRSLQAAPTMIPLGEVYTALQLGTVDGAEATTFIWPQTQWDKVIRYFTLLNYSCAPNFALLSTKFWSSLPPEVQQTITQAAGEVERYSYEKASHWNDEYLGMIDKKVEIIKLSAETLAAFKRAVEPVYEEYREKAGSKLIDLTADRGGRK